MSHQVNASATSCGEAITVACLDAVGRTRQVVVTRSGDRTVVRTPPGEIAILDPASADHLAEALHTPPHTAAPTTPRPALGTGGRP